MFVDEAGMVAMSAFNTEGEQLRPRAGRFDGTDLQPPAPQRTFINGIEHC